MIINFFLVLVKQITEAIIIMTVNTSTWNIPFKKETKKYFDENLANCIDQKVTRPPNDRTEESLPSFQLIQNTVD